ncbi:MAG: sigma-54-dependent Fis family transcriptional regulator [Planctomycetes bacterium]|nr:sigma-54-dependent Fis family transcriptional regulator [Planctomycetota bacterium]
MEEAATILVIDNNQESTSLLERGFRKSAFKLEFARSGADGLKILKPGQYDLAILSLDLPNESGLTVLQKIREADAALPVIVMADPSENDLITEAIKRGAFNWAPKVVDIDKLTVAIDSLVSKKGLLVEPVSLEGGLREEPGLKKIIGSSPKIRDVFKTIETVVASDVPVLLQGETGTGKELVAKAIHFRGPRRKYPFYAVNCAAIPEQLLESELFGHEKGAFTGAHELRRGKFELAHMGTLFLDEVSEMSATTQAKILRVIEEKAFERVGGTKLINVDVRVVSATNTDLRKIVKEGKFREDLYYRLAVFPISLPPLRDRGKDVPELIQYFLERYGTIGGKQVDKIAPEAMDKLVRYRWPGNVRQLQNCIRRAVLLTTNDTLRLEHFDLPDEAEGVAAATAEVSLDDEVNKLIAALQRGEVLPLHEVEGLCIRQALNITSGNVTEAADKLGISRSTIYRKLQEHGVAV